MPKFKRKYLAVDALERSRTADELSFAICRFAVSFEFLFGHKSGIIYQVVYVVAVVLGAVLKLDIVWTIADTFNGFMAVPNLIALLALSGVVTKLTKEYFSKKKVGV